MNGPASRARTLARVASVALWSAGACLGACHRTESSQQPEGTADAWSPSPPSSSPAPLASPNLRSVSGSGAKDVWAVGDGGVILHFDGKAWSPSPSGTKENLTGVHATAPTDAWACGDKGTILHWNGTAWSQAAQVSGATLLAIWASGPADAWAVGIDSSGEGGYLHKWNGTQWDGQGIPGSTSVWGVTGTGPHDVWMVGTTQRGTGLVLHGDGAKFDANGFEGSSVRSVWSVKPDDAWVAPYDGAVQRYGGKSWSALPTNTGALLHIAGSGPDDVWATGSNGVALHYHAGAWKPTPTGTTQIIWSVWSRAANDAWAVGNGGTMLRWNGTAWARGI